MIKTIKKNMYKAFGFTILSEILLPELPTKTDYGNRSDISIKYSDLSNLWFELAAPNKLFYIKENFVMFHIPDIAIYSIQDGNKILVSPMEGSEEDQIRLYLLGTCMGVILMQRRILPLHGSALAIDGKAYAIVGDSGAGKSTLASALLCRGYQLISDDVIPVSLNEEKIPVVTSAYPQQKLWQESLDAFGIDSMNLRPIIDRETKFAIPVHSQFSDEVLPLAGVFELIKTENDSIEIYPIENLNRLHTLYYHTYRNFLLKPLGLMEWHFCTIASMIGNIEMFQLQRPVSCFTAHELTRLILSTINKGVK